MLHACTQHSADVSQFPCVLRPSLQPAMALQGNAAVSPSTPHNEVDEKQLIVRQ